MTGPASDLRHAWRVLTQKPGFFVAALVTLAVGIGANITIFSLVNGISLRPMPFGDRTDRLITVHPTGRFITDEPSWGEAEISYPDLLDFRTASTVEGMAGYVFRNFVLSADVASAERVQGGSVTPDLFPLLGVEPMLGRQFRPEEAAAPGLESVVMLTHGLWQRRYGADPSIIGRPVMVNDLPRTVIGVLPEGFAFPLIDELYMPLRWDESSRSARNVNAVALLKPGVNLEQSRSEIEGIARRLAETYPETNRGVGVQVVPIRQSYVGADQGRMNVVLMAAVGFVLLIMCANLANLMLVRSASRQRELAVRAAMGAGRGRLIWVSLTESLLLAVPGSLIGLILSQWAIDAMVASFPEDLPYWFNFGLDWRVALFAFVTAAFTTIAVGLLPSIRGARPDLVRDLKEGGRGVSLGRGGQRLQAALAVSQVALCFGLLVGADLMVRSFLAMQTADLGFDHKPLLTARAYLAGDAYDDVAARAAFFRNAADQLARLPGAVAAAATTAIPGDDGGATRRLVIDGRTAETDEIGIHAIGMTPSLFATLNVPIVDGRTFTEQEAEDPAAAVAILNQSLANRLWPGERAIDRRVGFRGTQTITWLRVVGVVPDIHYEEISEGTEASRLNVYVPYSRDGSRSMALLVRASSSPGALVSPARDLLQSLSSTFPVYRLMPMSDLRRFTTWEQEFFGSLMGAFAIAALLLACLGIYALISYSVGRRSREIGVRLALGARPADVVGMLLRESARVGGVGLAVGLTLAVMIARGLAGTLYGVNVDAWLFVSTAVPLSAAIVAATWWPARRAARVEPTRALRDE